MTKEKLKKQILKHYDIEFPTELEFYESFELILEYLELKDLLTDELIS